MVSGLENRKYMMDELKSSLHLITNPKEAKPGELLNALQKMDEVLNDRRTEIHPRLLHFLQNRSYQKALTWINGGEPAKGTCGK
jgi:hypothetical protein